MGKIILKCIGISILAFMAVNLISFLIELYQTGVQNEFEFLWKHGTFFIDNKAVGMTLWSKKTIGFLVLLFIISFVMFNKEKLKKTDK